MCVSVCACVFGFVCVFVLFLQLLPVTGHGIVEQRARISPDRD